MIQYMCRHPVYKPKGGEKIKMKKSIILFLFVLLIFAVIVWMNVQLFTMSGVKVDSSGEALPGLAAATAFTFAISMVADLVLTLFASALGFFVARKVQKIAPHRVMHTTSLVLKYVFALLSIGATAILIYILAVLFG